MSAPYQWSYDESNFESDPGIWDRPSLPIVVAALLLGIGLALVVTSQNFFQMWRLSRKET